MKTLFKPIARKQTLPVIVPLAREDGLHDMNVNGKENVQVFTVPNQGKDVVITAMNFLLMDRNPKPERFGNQVAEMGAIQIVINPLVPIPVYNNTGLAALSEKPLDEWELVDADTSDVLGYQIHIHLPVPARSQDVAVSVRADLTRMQRFQVIAFGSEVRKIV